MKTSNCMCCGKTWSGHRLYRKKPKTESSRHHNAFCSRQCAKKYAAWENDRKARCGGCGKATGRSEAGKCEACRLTPANTWDRLFVQFMNQDHEHKPKSWDDKLRSMISTNMHREALAKPQRAEIKPLTRKRRRRSVWIDKWNEACSEMILKHNKDQAKAEDKDPWKNTLCNWQTNQQKRMRIKERRSHLKECEQS